MTKQGLTESFALNMEKERIALGYSQAKMANALGISISSYKRILNGETGKIDLYMIYKMYQLTHKLGYELGQIHDPYLDTFSRLRQLSDYQLNYINAILNFEIRFKETLSEKELPEDYTTVLIPTGDMQDGMIYDSCDFEKINIAPYRKRYGNLIDCGLRITSTHFLPVYHLDDILLISHQPIRDGDTGVFIDASNCLIHVRRFQKSSPCRLVPINNYGSTICVDLLNEADSKRWIGFGRVVTKMRI